MQLGISPFASTRAVAVQLSEMAVHGGLGTLWLGDGLLANPDFPGWSGAMEPFGELAWLAGRFPSARVGVSAAVLPVRDIAWLVKQASTLDQLTEGSFVLGVAPGFWAHELAWRGVPWEERGARFAEAVAALQAGFAGQPFEGRWHRLPAAGRLSPEPFTPGGPPLWLAGAEATMARALALGLPFQVSRATPEQLAPVAHRWREGGGGLLGARIRIAVAGDVPKGHAVDWHALAGPAAFLAEQLAAYRDLGVGDISLIPGQDDATSLATVEALVADVVPALT